MLAIVRSRPLVQVALGQRAVTQRTVRAKPEPITLENIQLAKLPTRPKRPASAYNLFYVDKFDSVRRANPELKVTELSKIIAAAWKSAPKEARIKYEKESEIRSPEYRQQISDYNAFMKRKVTLEQVAQLLQEQARALGLRKPKVHSDRPRKSSGWVAFMKENVTGTKGKPDLGAIAAKWKSLSDNAKQQYNQRAAQEFAKRTE